MTVSTRFDEGDKIFFLQKAKVFTTIVRGFVIEKKGKGAAPVTTYLCHEQDKEKQNHILVPELEAFGSKEELLKSL